MNETYLVNENNNNQEVEVVKSKPYEDSVYARRKMRLGQLRERTKKLLKNHNWERFFEPISGGDDEDDYDEDYSADFARSISVINRLEYDTLMQDEPGPAPQLRNDTKFEINLMPLLLNTSTFVNKPYECGTLGVVEFTSTPPALSSTKRKLEMEQSLTFIGDLAQTSTPRRRKAEPITSTPKVVNHDPLKYHPTHTIRNKHKAAQRKAAREQELFQLKKQHTKCRVQFDCACCREQLRKRALVNVKQSLVSLTESTIIQSNLNRLAVRAQQKQHKPSTRIKFKTSNIEISLEDFLYTPSKMAKLDLAAPKPKMKSVTSKIYYL